MGFRRSPSNRPTVYLADDKHHLYDHITRFLTHNRFGSDCPNRTGPRSNERDESAPVPYLAANRPSGAETSGYEEGDAFDCPVCGDTHTVTFDEDEIMKGHETDTSVLSVDCSDASAGKMYVEFQARTRG